MPSVSRPPFLCLDFVNACEATIQGIDLGRVNQYTTGTVSIPATAVAIIQLNHRTRRDSAAALIAASTKVVATLVTDSSPASVPALEILCRLPPALSSPTNRYPRRGSVSTYRGVFGLLEN